MSLESFFGLEEGESQGSAEAAEAFREQLRKNAKAIKAMNAHQQQQKQKEDRMAKILVKFLQDQSRADIVFLIIKLLQENVPGAFILAVLAIIDADLEKELELDFKNNEKTAAQSLINFSGENTLPDSIREELNAWGEAIITAGMLMPDKTLESVLTPDQKLKSIVLDLIHYSLEEYFDRHGLEFPDDKINQFALLSVQSVLIKLREASKEMSDAERIETPLENDN